MYTPFAISVLVLPLQQLPILLKSVEVQRKFLPIPLYSCILLFRTSLPEKLGKIGAIFWLSSQWSFLNIWLLSCCLHQSYSLRRPLFCCPALKSLWRSPLFIFASDFCSLSFWKETVQFPCPELCFTMTPLGVTPVSDLPPAEHWSHTTQFPVTARHLFCAFF